MRYSKRCEEVYACVCATTQHLSAEEVYAQLSHTSPGIGIATVYRNLNALCEEGRLRRIKSSDGIDHFDGNVHSHPHFVCCHCHKVFDYHMSNYAAAEKAILKDAKWPVDDIEIVVHGVCEACQELEKTCS